MRLVLVFGLLVCAGSAGAQQSTNPHGALNVPCAECHAPEGWKPARIAASFKHAPRTFPLEGAHVRTSCTSCHKTLDFKGVIATCASCHEDVHKGELGVECSRCHTPRNFVDEPAMKQAHELTRFPLRGPHAAVTCSSCHTPGGSGRLQYVGTSTSCAGCHAADARAAVPDHKAAGFAGECTSCHTSATWKGARFDHTQTAFPLVGAHQAVTCQGCHADKVYDGRSTQCVACHQGDYDRADAPRHVDAFPTTCADCHGNTTWEGARFDHNTTRFALTGAHNAVSCAGCHADDVYRGKSMECASCHQTVFRATTNPPHGTALFTAPCSSCHTTNAWAGAAFNHDATKFALTGSHRAATCAGCHADRVFAGKPSDCFSCHRAKYEATTTPAHAAAGYPTTCTTCHNTTEWKGAFNHSTTRFPLTGAHNAVTCATCHADGVYRGRPMECVSCHQTNFLATTNPPHGPSLFTAPCSACHTTNAWAGASFDHDVTRFKLTGSHRAATCAGCHADRVFAGKPSTCISCHQSDLAGARTPPHTGFPSTCESCHATGAWTGATFDHNATDFPLTGSHRTATCAGCHADGVFNGKPSECISCHRARYDATTRPAHAAAGYSTACATCHTTTQWLGAVFDHSTTQFPLTGAHRAVTCATCHADNVFRGKPTNCLACHQSDYSATRSPPHASNGIGTTCQTCHRTTAWAGGTFNHAVTAFPLTGAHTTTTCQSCHGDGVYRGKSSTCVSCHQTDYNQTTNPNHAAASFPTTCAGCHSTTTWLGATFNHDAQFFPINSGKHRGKWSSCATCHTSPTNYKVFTCLSCHEHRQTEMDDKHKGRSGYRYDSQSCYSCHPQGRGG